MVGSAWPPTGFTWDGGWPAKPSVVVTTDSLIEISQAGKLLRVHQVKHDPIKAHGAFANPGGQPDRINAAR